MDISLYHSTVHGCGPTERRRGRTCSQRRQKCITLGHSGHRSAPRGNQRHATFRAPSVISFLFVGEGPCGWAP
eukprot:682604-Prorocentrum_minimum.AAC.1